MLGIVVQLILSFVLLRYVGKTNMTVLGITPTLKRVQVFLIFLLIMSLASASSYAIRMWIADERWHWNPDIKLSTLGNGIWWNIKSVLFEELIFRGALFYLLLQRLGWKWAIVISSLAFGIYHWFSQELFGNLPQMAMIGTMSAIMGAVYAFGYVKTGTLWAPIGMHLGWNWVRSVWFSDTVIGNQLLVQVAPAPQVTVGYGAYFFFLLFPLLSGWIASYWFASKSPPHSGLITVR